MTRIDLSVRAARHALAGVVDVHADDAWVVERFARIVWGALCEPGDTVAARVLEAEDAATALRLLFEGRLDAVPDIAPHELAEGVKRWMPRVGGAGILPALERARLRGVRHVAPGDPDWPSALSDLGPAAPLGLWVRGDRALLRAIHPAVALVGARASTSYGEHVAIEIASDLASGGVAIVSGAAYGIDGAAHRSALAAAGATVAVLAGGVDRPYPAGHAELIDRIAGAGVVVSEVPCGASPTKWRFLARNRLIAALGDATVVVEAGWRSGALNTAGHAAALGRGLGAVPGPVTSAASAGCHRLLREYDAVCVTSADDVRELLPLSHRESRRGAGVTSPSGTASMGRPATGDAARVRDALSTRSWRDADDLASRSGMAVHDVTAHLGLMSIAGEVEKRDDGSWRRRGGAVVRAGASSPR